MYVNDRSADDTTLSIIKQLQLKGSLETEIMYTGRIIYRLSEKGRFQLKALMQLDRYSN